MVVGEKEVSLKVSRPFLDFVLKDYFLFYIYKKERKRERVSPNRASCLGPRDA
jgi:hypothetical protein